MACPYLEYRRDAAGGDGGASADADGAPDSAADASGAVDGERDAAGGRRFDGERAYCTVVDEFVQPMRADVCNDRYDLSHATHCEYYRGAEGAE
jgi:hypothetical protein